MKRSDKILLAFPQDPTIKFLDPVYEHLQSVCINLAAYRVSDTDFLDQLITKEKPSLIIFMGHGTSAKLMGGIDLNQRRSTFWQASWKGIKVDSLLLACNSVEFYKKVFKDMENSQLNYFGFGDIPTDWDHINDLKTKKKKPFHKKFEGFTDEHLDYFNAVIVESVIAGFELGFAHESFHGFFQGLSQKIFQKVNHVVLETKWDKDQKIQLAELLMAFRHDIRYQEAS